MTELQRTGQQTVRVFVGAIALICVLQFGALWMIQSGGWAIVILLLLQLLWLFVMLMATAVCGTQVRALWWSGIVGFWAMPFALVFLPFYLFSWWACRNGPCF
jgi:hypothetical protein